VARRVGLRPGGVRSITPDRAGYGQASSNADRTVADEAADVRFLVVVAGPGFEPGKA
jgi:hypothetical protein